MFLLRDLRFLLCSLDLDVLCAQRIMGLVTHKSMRSQNPVTWWELRVRTNSRDLVVLQIKCSQLGTAIQTVDWSHAVVTKHQVLQLTEISTIQGFNFVVLLWDRNEHPCAGILFAFTNTCNTTLNRPVDLFFFSKWRPYNSETALQKQLVFKITL